MKIAREIRVAGSGKPRRHDAFFGEVCDLPGVRFDVAVGQKRKRSCFAGMVAGSASAKDDGREIFIERDAFFFGRVLRSSGREKWRTGHHNKTNRGKENSGTMAREIHSRSEM